MADQAPIPEPKDGFPHDIVFLQDVIARHARLEWYPEECAPVDSASFIPARWSRRRPSATDDMKSVVCLCSLVPSQEGWAFITALTTFLKGDWDGNEGKRLLPVRQLDFNDLNTASIFREIHNLGNWVVNFDKLLDRRQLLNQGDQITDDAEQAVKWITRFYRNFHSMRFVKHSLVIRLKHRPSPSALEALNEDFADIVAGERIQAIEPTADEVEENELVELPRISSGFDRRSYGRLRQLIDVLNGY